VWQRKLTSCSRGKPRLFTITSPNGKTGTTRQPLALARMAGSAGCRLVQIRESAVDGRHSSNRIPWWLSWWVILSDVCLLSQRTLQEYTYAETKTMTHTVGVVVGVAYMLMWTNHHSAGVVTWLLSTNQGVYRSMPNFLLLACVKLSNKGLCGYLFKARCKWFAYGPASWCHWHQKSRFQNGLPFWLRLSQTILDIRPLNKVLFLLELTAMLRL